MSLQVHHIVPRIHLEASGPSYSVPRLCEALAQRSLQIGLHIVNPAPRMRDEKFSLSIYPHWRFLTRLLISPEMNRALRKIAQGVDILHNHSLWTMPNVYPEWAVRGSRCLLFTSPRGTLSKWALGRNPVLKRMMWLAVQKKVLLKSFCLHATSESEYREIRDLGLNMPVAIIPNGIDIPPSSDSGVRGNADEPRNLLFLSRIHPKKGIDILLSSWKKVSTRFEGWRLLIVGPDNDGYLEEMKHLSQSLNLSRIEFLGPLFGAEKERILRKADLFVLPSHSENFGLVVAEALSYGIPCIVSKGSPWGGLPGHDCGWWIDQGEEALTGALCSTLSLPREQLRVMGVRGREWMISDFSWEKIGEMMHLTYLWALGKSQKPEWVKIDGRGE